MSNDNIINFLAQPIRDAESAKDAEHIDGVLHQVFQARLALYAAALSAFKDISTSNDVSDSLFFYSARDIAERCADVGNALFEAFLEDHNGLVSELMGKNRDEKMN